MSTKKLEWSDRSGSTVHTATGHRDVLFIVSEEGGGAWPEAVERRPALELSREVREELENQGIARQDQGDDLALMRARYGRDRRCSISRVLSGSGSGGSLSRETVLQHISTLMSSNTEGGVVLCYMGPGRRNTGDWCFQDGFITFSDLTRLYLQQFRGRVLTVVTDCSHSGQWVKECMTFLDQQGVGPCGHAAREKGVCLKVLASCLAHQVPRRLVHSMYRCGNDPRSGDLLFYQLHDYICPEASLADAQHASGLDATQLRCGRGSIQDKCLCLPQASWHLWSARRRLYTVRGSSGERGSRQWWKVVLLVDCDQTVLTFVEQTQGGREEEEGEEGEGEEGAAQVNVEDYGEVVRSGTGLLSYQQHRTITQKYRTYSEGGGGGVSPPPDKESHSMSQVLADVADTRRASQTKLRSPSDPPPRSRPVRSTSKRQLPYLMHPIKPRKDTKTSKN